MYEQDRAILRSLVSVAWADGSFEEREKQMLDALIESFGATTEEADEIRAYSTEKRSLDDIPLTDLSADDRRVLLNHAVVLSWVDGSQDESEKAFLTQLAAKLHIPDDEAKAIVDAGNARASQLLKLLES